MSGGYGYARSLEYVSDFWREKYERENTKNWDLFYKGESKKGYLSSTKERNYLLEDLQPQIGASDCKHVLELGCGGGHSIQPLLSNFPELKVSCCDTAPRAVALVQGNPDLDQARITPFVCDIQNNEFPEFLTEDKPQIILSVFVLSALGENGHVAAIQHMRKIAEPGKTVIYFRDYAVGDKCQLEFDKQYPPRKISTNFYARPDGTRAYFFDKEYLARIFEENGFKLIDEVETVEFHSKKHDRYFLRAKFIAV